MRSVARTWFKVNQRESTSDNANRDVNPWRVRRSSQPLVRLVDCLQREGQAGDGGASPARGQIYGTAGTAVVPDTPDAPAATTIPGGVVAVGSALAA